jgi:DNA-binding CsgD family transcriptional regulator
MAHSIDASLVLPAIGRIYDAALDPSVWTDVINGIAALHGTDKAVLFTPLHTANQGGILFSAGISETMIQQRATEYGQYDVWMQATQEKGLLLEGGIVTDEDLYPHEALLKTVFYRDFLSKQGIARVCSGVVFGIDSPGMPPTGLSVFRGLMDQAFGSQERALHSTLIPHISRAMGIMFRLRDAELKVASTLSGFDRLTSGIILLGVEGEVVFANRSARRALQMEDGLRLRSMANGKTHLAANRPDDHSLLNSAIKQCTEPNVIEVSHYSNAVRVNRPSGRAAFAINFSALPEQNEFGSGQDRPCAIVILSDPDEPIRVEAEVLKRLYALTAAECRLAACLCNGETLSVIAKELGLSENTVKTQLQSIFDKTETRRQVQLVKLLAGLGSSNTY